MTFEADLILDADTSGKVTVEVVPAGVADAKFAQMNAYLQQIREAALGGVVGFGETRYEEWKYENR